MSTFEKIRKFINSVFPIITIVVISYLAGAFSYPKDKPCSTIIIQTVSERKDACEKLGGSYTYTQSGFRPFDYYERCIILEKEIKEF